MQCSSAAVESVDHSVQVAQFRASLLCVLSLLLQAVDTETVKQ
eukprot:COSAG03_NODE_3987_length_1730_cov_1.557940_3_plen_42_part_01